MPEPIAEILSLLPEATALTAIGRSRLYDFLETRLHPQALRLRLSPYQEHAHTDPLRVGVSYPAAIASWLRQFPDEHRLGLLTGLLNLKYLTEGEERSFFDVAQARLVERLADAEADPALIYPAIAPRLSTTLRALSVSAFPHFDRFVDSLRIAGQRDRDVYPFRQELDSILSALSESLSYVTDNPAAPEGYYEHHETRLLTFVKSVVNTNLLLIEDSSYSGTRVASKASQLIRLLGLLFPSRLANTLAAKSLRPPAVYVVLSYATPDAVDALSPDALMRSSGVQYPDLHLIVGFTFGADASMRQLPHALCALGEILGVDVLTAFRASCRFFLDSYGKHYLTETGVAAGARIGAEDMLYGFKNGCWTILPHSNAPNNCLTYLWYPHTRSTIDSIHALFPRVDSHLTHADGPAPPTTVADLSGRQLANVVACVNQLVGRLADQRQT